MNISHDLSIGEQSVIVGIPGMMILSRFFGIKNCLYSFFGVAMTAILQPDWLIRVVKMISDKRIGKGVIYFNRAPLQIAQMVEKPLISLTIDDCPAIKRRSAEVYTSLPLILDALKKHNVRATLFVMSEGVDERLEKLLVRAIREGHELGNHHFRDEMSVSLDMNEFKYKLRQTDRLLERVYSNSSNSIWPKKWFRPGGGLITRKQAKVVNQDGYRIALGSFLAPDPLIRIPRVTAWLLRQRVKEGCVIIIHDRPWTPKMLERILPYLSSSFTVSTLSDLAEE